MRLDLDPVRVRALRERIGMPLTNAAKRSKLSVEFIERLEREGGPVEVEDARRLAKAYNRNWYVFLLDDEPGRPALPHDFRRLGRGRPISPETLIAFDDAEALVERILDLPRDDEIAVVDLPAITDLSADTAAAEVRAALGVSVDDQRLASAEYDSIRLWAKALSRAGLYVAQMSFPYRDVRAFCLRRDRVSLIVVSTRDSPRARVFSMLHETSAAISCSAATACANRSRRAEVSRARRSSAMPSRQRCSCPPRASRPTPKRAGSSVSASSSATPPGSRVSGA